MKCDVGFLHISFIDLAKLPETTEACSERSRDTPQWGAISLVEQSADEEDGQDKKRMRLEQFEHFVDRFC
jgi:hypothetical protein